MIVADTHTTPPSSLLGGVMPLSYLSELLGRLQRTRWMHCPFPPLARWMHSQRKHHLRIFLCQVELRSGRGAASSRYVQTPAMFVLTYSPSLVKTVSFSALGFLTRGSRVCRRSQSRWLVPLQLVELRRVLGAFRVDLLNTTRITGNRLYW